MIKYFQEFKSNLDNFFFKDYHPLVLLHTDINKNNDYSELIFIERFYLMDKFF